MISVDKGLHNADWVKLAPLAGGVDNLDAELEKRDIDPKDYAQYPAVRERAKTDPALKAWVDRMLNA